MISMGCAGEVVHHDKWHTSVREPLPSSTKNITYCDSIGTISIHYGCTTKFPFFKRLQVIFCFRVFRAFCCWNRFFVPLPLKKLTTKNTKNIRWNEIIRAMMYFIQCTTKAHGGGLQKWANQNTEPASSWSDRVIQKKGKMSYTHSLLIIWLEYLSGIRFQ